MAENQQLNQQLNQQQLEQILPLDQATQAKLNNDKKLKDDFYDAMIRHLGELAAFIQEKCQLILKQQRDEQKIAELDDKLEKYLREAEETIRTNQIIAKSNPPTLETETNADDTDQRESAIQFLLQKIKALEANFKILNHRLATAKELKSEYEVEEDFLEKWLKEVEKEWGTPGSKYISPSKKASTLTPVLGDEFLTQISPYNLAAASLMEAVIIQANAPTAVNNSTTESKDDDWGPDKDQDEAATRIPLYALLGSDKLSSHSSTFSDKQLENTVEAFGAIQGISKCKSEIKKIDTTITQINQERLVIAKEVDKTQIELRNLEDNQNKSHLSQLRPKMEKDKNDKNEKENGS